MRTIQQRAEQLYLNCLDMGCGFRHEGDKVIVLAPSKRGHKGQAHPVLQALIDKYFQPIFVTLVPRHGVRPDTWRQAEPPTVDKMAVIRRAVDGAKRQAARKKQYSRG